jgi:cell division septum initiation protein DivIVA
MEHSARTEALSSSTFREATFPQALLGYEKRSVHEFLTRIADWIDEHGELPTEAESQLKSEFAQVGERTSGILAAAEEAAAKLRADAKESAARLRAEAEEEARAVRLNASQHADELVSKAQEKADHVLEEAVTRRRKLNQSLAGLQQRRDEVAQETQRLADNLHAAIEALRVDQEADLERDAAASEAEADAAAGAEPGGEPVETVAPVEPVEPDERETAVHRTA